MKEPPHLIPSALDLPRSGAVERRAAVQLRRDLHNALVEPNSALYVLLCALTPEEVQVLRLFVALCRDERRVQNWKQEQ